MILKAMEATLQSVEESFFQQPYIRMKVFLKGMKISALILEKTTRTLTDFHLSIYLQIVPQVKMFRAGFYSRILFHLYLVLPPEIKNRNF